MKVKVSRIEQGEYTVREELDDDHVKEIADSFEEDGQWNPIIVRPSENGSEYDVIAGHNRLAAAKRLGWDEIDAEVKDVDESEADLLSLKTNLLRQEMKQIEQGRVLNKMLQEHGLSQKELAEKIGKSRSWVNRRVRLALDLHEDVVDLLDEEKISSTIAATTGSIEKSKQPEFAKYVLREDVNNREDAYEAKRRFENDTIFTTGYQGKDWNDFIEELQNNKIDILIDVRESADSQYKPEFNGDVMGDRLADDGIEYIHQPELGVPYNVRGPYTDGWIGDDCFEGWYQWHVYEETDFDLAEFVGELEEKGKPAIMCMERYATATRDQEHNCHRDHLADLMQRVVETDDGFALPKDDSRLNARQVFPERVDL